MALTTTSYIVLGFVEQSGGATPYGLKRRLRETGALWPVPHSQIYSETERLAASGHLEERREDGGRRRRTYSLTDKGRSALGLWRKARSRELPELRDPGLLQLFFGADPASLGPARADLHRRRLRAYEALLEDDDGSGPRGPWLALRAGIAHERASVEFWTEVS